MTITKCNKADVSVPVPEDGLVEASRSVPLDALGMRLSQMSNLLLETLIDTPKLIVSYRIGRWCINSFERHLLIAHSKVCKICYACSFLRLLFCR